MTTPGYFDDLYAERDDPWGLSCTAYEERKYALSVAALTHERYERAFEPGCSIGVLTAELAPRCGTLLSMDGAPRAVEQATARLADVANVRVELGRVPADWPSGSYDLIVLSELMYFLDAADRSAVALRCGATLAPGGQVLAVHWRHSFDEAPTNGDVVHEELFARLTAHDCARVVQHVEPDFRLDVYERA